ncbi:hypothetical protein A3A93_01690 [Candidatus Roizmanbacteria bacterium RIFCSPLOWO2_01_FULL_38_12]|uniref:Uncharacterized protein n=1 Tax=Candidatus Roizmanbacteria bacterium RIFCSPLOWO2_01_FULL_38_12 TaxID=1802061 RepID=A0A1F7IYA4_9BACT|nr:MAG: hypothetical protein A2861_02315 [Candidatus Roizmanbacteria bacterium RIFCSPHIGHO2_01_FULL_38_15]OGK34502.1 MAG: hypothetical protein A3F59_04215 [Candidatus Roizmanbacteria bacterium RIFCSPHIGHO2_12_FULL_38_13]OGK48331.1 MAG: hypothetical protein A3A93_01690 [Candidatus Roizmanbacteria bacterium RIFCSPLOWO2_01_FULL_38_12]
MKRVHLILTGLTLTIVLLSINRLSNFTQGYLQPFEFLRWLDFNAMLPIPLFSIILYYLLKREIVYENAFLKTGKYILLMVILITGIYFFGAGSGDHEVTNYLNFRFCDQGKVNSPICNIIKYNDDEFSHYVYYVGFILMNVALMLIEYNLPRKNGVTKKDLILIAVNSLFIALGIFANLAFEEIGLDLVFFGSVMLLSIYLLLQKSYKRLPITFYFAVAYTFGVVGTLFYKII